MDERLLTRPLLLPGLACALAVVAAAAPASGAEEAELVYRSGQWVRPAEPKEGTPAGELALIRQHLRQGREWRTVRAVKKYLKRYPLTPLREEAMSLAGEAELARGRLYQAYEWFDRQIENHPNGDLLPQALQRCYEIGDAFLDGRRRIVVGVLYLHAYDEGVEILTRVAEEAPASRLAEKALLRVADFRYRRRQYAEAADVYDQFYQLYGESSDRAPYAMLQAARATYASFGGVRYDITPLLEAEQRFKRFARLYPDRAADANVSGVLGQIRDTRAQRLYMTARLYERTRKPRAAAHYYRLLDQRYRRSDWARRGRIALRKLRESGRIAPAPSDSNAREEPTP